ncbi:MAG: hypothetical protein WDK96_00165 [Candidatus Paceibacterota bacterium]|jgi:hypothetical protein
MKNVFVEDYSSRHSLDAMIVLTKVYKDKAIVFGGSYLPEIIGKWDLIFVNVHKIVDENKPFDLEEVATMCGKEDCKKIIFSSNKVLLDEMRNRYGSKDNFFFLNNSVLMYAFGDDKTAIDQLLSFLL